MAKLIYTLIIIVVIALLCNNCHYVKAIINYPPRDSDYQKFDVKKIQKSEEPFFFNKKVNNEIGEIQFVDLDEAKSLRRFLKDSETQVFLLIKNDTIVYEFYDYGYTRNDPISVWSLTKVFVSSLTHIAIQEGYITSTQDSILHYIPELKGKVREDVTIQHLLLMNSGINYTGDTFELGPYLHVHYDNDLEKFGLKAQSKIPPGLKYRYSQTDLILLAMILRRAIKQPLYQYLEAKIWQPIGMEHDAYWMVDKTEQALERTASGLFATPEDIAKLGRLFLNNGSYKDGSLLSSNWVEECIHENSQYHKKHMINFWRHTQIPKVDTTVNAIYLPDSLILKTEGDAFVNGANNNKLLFLLPKDDLMIVRFGKGITNKDIKNRVLSFAKTFQEYYSE